MTDISIRNVRKSYGKAEVIHGIDLEITDGQFVVFLGPSGCGKSTMLRMIAGLESITGGEIAIGGTVVNKLSPRERGCAMVFQNYGLYPHMTVADNIGYALRVARVPTAERRRRVEAVAATVGLADVLGRKPAALSGGQRQRVAMARAIVREPKAFLFDEPLSNLDATLRAAMRLEIRRLHNRLKATTIFVTHDQVEAMTLADRIVVMRDGRIEQVGAPLSVYERPVSRFVAAFIGAPPMNLLPGIIDDAGHVKTSGGTRLAFDPLQFAVAAGQPVDIGVRPEALGEAQDTSDGTLPFTCEFVEELGSSHLMHGDSEGQHLIVALRDAPRGPLAQHRHLAVPAGHIHLFDAATGASLRSPEA